MKGYKTYLAAIIAIGLEGVKVVFPEHAEVASSAQVIAGFLGLAFLRAGVKRALGR
jgi:hypothetical protein